MMRAMPLEVHDLGLLEYAQAHELQQRAVSRRAAEEIPDTLLLLEHPAVITLGRGSHAENVISPGNIPVVPCERGGDVTLHAPGQLVGYAILRLGAAGLHGHLRLLEQVLLRVCAQHGLHGELQPGATGVWIGGRKLASIGIACRRHVTWHGFALNVSTDLALFEAIRPCGFSSAVMTSLARECGAAPALSAVKAQCADALAQALGTEWRPLR